MMKKKYVAIIISILFNIPLSALTNQANDTSMIDFSLYYFVDLSDTYGGGEIFSGEIGFSRSWYGACLGYGHFQSQSTFILKVPVENPDGQIGIPFDEMAIMKNSSLSLKILPIRTSWINAELIFGIAFAKAEWSCYKSVDYSYSIVENRFTQLIRDYQLIKSKHFGYQVGLNIVLCPLKFADFKLSARMQDLNRGGTFFFVGGGISLKI
ncbi:MAG TPA: hypothetical protein PKL65_00690 [Bacteroidales bacterium]|nr:hypothetical protein [Bacteroidales bacterium]HNR40722.1 hypothetical protein [Bacteroidales bacterium]